MAPAQAKKATIHMLGNEHPPIWRLEARKFSRQVTAPPLKKETEFIMTVVITLIPQPRSIKQNAIQVMALRKQVRTLEVELVHARVSGLAGVAFGSRGGEISGWTADGGGGDGGGEAARAAQEEAAELRRYAGDVLASHHIVNATALQYSTVTLVNLFVC